MNIESISTHDDQNEEIFYHFYDLTISPPTFNFVYSLIVAELVRGRMTHTKQSPEFPGRFNTD
jgi:hypothetical protein